MIVISIIGPSGSGKTTFTRNISRFLTCHVIHVDEMLYKKYPNHQDAGVVPECLVWDIICGEMGRTQTEVIILDGYPKTLSQLASFERVYSLPALTLVFHAVCMRVLPAKAPLSQWELTYSPLNQKLLNQM